MLLQSFFREIVLDKPHFVFLFHPLMTPQFGLQIGKLPFQQIGGIEDAQVRVTLKGKEIRQIAFQAVVSASQAGMGVTGFVCQRICRAFVQKCFMPLVPCLQSGFKVSLRAVFQGQGKRFQLACRKAFGATGEVALDDLDLVELA